MLKILCAALTVALVATAQAGTVVVKAANGQMVRTSTVNSMSGCKANARSLGYKEPGITNYCTGLMRRIAH
jgi:hypothetical protein